MGCRGWWQWLLTVSAGGGESDSGSLGSLSKSAHMRKVGPIYTDAKGIFSLWRHAYALLWCQPVLVINYRLPFCLGKTQRNDDDHM